MALVTDVVNCQDGGHGGVQRRRVGRGVNQIDGGATSGAREADGGPSQVRRRMPGFRTCRTPLGIDSGEPPSATRSSDASLESSAGTSSET